MGVRYTTAGESHGKMLVGIIENIPYGLTIGEQTINVELKRRMSGYGRGGRMLIEQDGAQIVSGVYGGKCIGSPIAVLINNVDCREQWDSLTAVRPGHADYAGAVKLGISDARVVSERASARSTAMTVALGAIAKQYLTELGIFVGSHTVAIGGVTARVSNDYNNVNTRADKSAVRCLDDGATHLMMQQIDEAAANGDSLGGVAEVIVTGCKAGFGSYTCAADRLDGRIMRAVGAIPSVKAVEIGDGVNGANELGSAFHDGFSVNGAAVFRTSNHAGGIEGGMTNGMPIIVRAYVKPIPTLARGAQSVDLKTLKQCVSAKERADVCAVPAVGVIGEAAVALELCAALSEALGDGTMPAVKARYGAAGL